MAHQVKTGYRYRFYPTPEQENLLVRTVGCARWVYNRALEMRQEKWNKEKKSLSSNKISKLLPDWKKEHKWLAEVSSVCLQQALRNLDRAYTNFFEGRAKYPKKKKKSKGSQSAKFHKDGFTFKDGQITLAKMAEPLKIIWHRPLPSKPTSVTVTLQADGRWFISCHIEMEVEYLPRIDKEIGIDLGLKDVIVTSDGDKTGNPRHFKKRFKKLRKAQRALARKELKSANRKKAKKAVARQHARIKDARRDFLHKLSSKLVRENQVIVMEDLNVKGLARGRHAKSVHDVAWGTLKGFLSYKCERYGRELILVDRYLASTQTCSKCDAKTGPKGLEELHVREWTCSACGAHHDRDVNSAEVILAAGTAARRQVGLHHQSPPEEQVDDRYSEAAACGGGLRPESGSRCKAHPMKQGIKEERLLSEATSIVTPQAA